MPAVWTDPSDYNPADGDNVRAADHLTYFRDNILYLAKGTKFVGRQEGYVVPSNTHMAVPMDYLLFDEALMWDATTQLLRIPSGGIWFVSVSVTWPVNNVGDRGAYLLAYTPGGIFPVLDDYRRAPARNVGPEYSTTTSGVYIALSGDTSLGVEVWQDSGATMDINVTFTVAQLKL
jgi:hypothetical protein